MESKMNGALKENKNKKSCPQYLAKSKNISFKSEQVFRCYTDWLHSVQGYYTLLCSQIIFLDGKEFVWYIQEMNRNKHSQKKVRKQEEPVRDKHTAKWFEGKDKLKTKICIHLSVAAL